MTSPSNFLTRHRLWSKQQTTAGTSSKQSRAFGKGREGKSLLLSLKKNRYFKILVNTQYLHACSSSYLVRFLKPLCWVYEWFELGIVRNSLNTLVFGVVAGCVIYALKLVALGCFKGDYFLWFRSPWEQCYNLKDRFSVRRSVRSVFFSFIFGCILLLLKKRIGLWTFPALIWMFSGHWIYPLNRNLFLFVSLEIDGIKSSSSFRVGNY